VHVAEERNASIWVQSVTNVAVQLVDLGSGCHGIMSIPSKMGTSLPHALSVWPRAACVIFEMEKRYKR